MPDTLPRWVSWPKVGQFAEQDANSPLNYNLMHEQSGTRRMPYDSILYWVGEYQNAWKEAVNTDRGPMHVVNIGGRLQPVYGALRVATTTPAPAPTAASGGTYTVRAGDTLGGIAARHGTTVQAVAQANGIANVNLIFVGQVLRIPGAGVVPQGSNLPPGTPPPQSNAGQYLLIGGALLVLVLLLS